jgi:hypothetical protein
MNGSEKNSYITIQGNLERKGTTLETQSRKDNIKIDFKERGRETISIGSRMRTSGRVLCEHSNKP